MTDQSAQLQAVEQALQEKGIKYRIDKANMDEMRQSTTITVEIYDTGNDE